MEIDGGTAARLGVEAARAGRFVEARGFLVRAVAVDPANAGRRLNLGLVLENLGDSAGAATEYARALAADPTSEAAIEGLSAVAEARSDLAPAVWRLQLVARPADPTALANLGVRLRSGGRPVDAVRALRRAVVLEPDRWTHAYNLGNAFVDANRPLAATTAYLHAAVLEPARAEIPANLASRGFAATARAGEAARYLDRAIRIVPRMTALSSMRLALMQYLPEVSATEVARAHREWGGRFPDRPFAAVSPPEPRMRVGFVSPDFRAHPVGYFVEPLLRELDRGRFELFCYSHTGNPDAVTTRLAGIVDRWRDVVDLDDETTASGIIADGVHVLIDLAGHTLGNRLGVFARRAAPVQATWAGYVGTTGLPAMDFLISDPRQSPAEAEGLGGEVVVRLPDVYVPWVPPADAPDVVDPPMLRNGFVTFGSLNAAIKLNAPLAALWARVLDAVPGSRLLLHTPGFDEPGAADAFLDALARAGASPERVALGGGAPRREFLAKYGEIDIAFDPRPYSGGLTTLEALWMGVPTVTLPGRRFCSRHALAHLTAAGLGHLAVETEDEYVAVAAALANDPGTLTTLRRGARTRAASSPSCDGRRFARAFEGVLEEMWRRRAPSVERG